MILVRVLCPSFFFDVECGVAYTIVFLQPTFDRLNKRRGEIGECIGEVYLTISQVFDEKSSGST